MASPHVTPLYRIKPHTRVVVLTAPTSGGTSVRTLKYVNGNGKHALAPEYEGSTSSTDPSESLANSPAVKVSTGRPLF